MFLNADEISAVEDLRKWTVDDVYNFISNIPSCSEHAQAIHTHKHLHKHLHSHMVLPSDLGPVCVFNSDV